MRARASTWKSESRTSLKFGWIRDSGSAGSKRLFLPVMGAVRMAEAVAGARPWQPLGTTPASAWGMCPSANEGLVASAGQARSHHLRPGPSPALVLLALRGHRRPAGRLQKHAGRLEQLFQTPRRRLALGSPRPLLHGRRSFRPSCLNWPSICLGSCLIRGDFGCRLVLRRVVKLLVSLRFGGLCDLLPRWTSRVQVPSPAPKGPRILGPLFCPRCANEGIGAHEGAGS